MNGLSFINYPESTWLSFFTNVEDVECPTDKCLFTDKGTSTINKPEFDSIFWDNKNQFSIYGKADKPSG